jgi:hypothetical protein
LNPQSIGWRPDRRIANGLLVKIVPALESDDAAMFLTGHRRTLLRGMVMKANKALKRLAKVEESVSNVMERYSASAPHIREALQDAKAAVTRAKEAVSSQASSGTRNAPKKAAAKKAPVKLPPAKAVKKHRPTKQDYEG